MLFYSLLRINLHSEHGVFRGHDRCKTSFVGAKILRVATPGFVK